MISMTRSLVVAAMLAVPAYAGDVDDVMATPSRAADRAATSGGNDEVADYLKTVHGEVTAMVGTGGTYGVSGTAVLPLGENGQAIVTLSTGQGPGWIVPYGYRPRVYGQDYYSYDNRQRILR